MDLFSVSIYYEILILADDAAGAEQIAEEICEAKKIRSPCSKDFRFSALKLYYQSDELKAEALNA